MIREGEEAFIPLVVLIKSGSGSDRVRDVLLPKRFEPFANRQYFEFLIPKEKVLKWFNDVPSKIQVENFSVKRKNKLLSIPEQELLYTGDDTPLIGVGRKPTAYYYRFHVNKEKIESCFREEWKGRTPVEEIRFIVRDWED